MLQIDTSRYGFRFREIWFAGAPHDVEDADRVSFMDCRSDAGGQERGFDCRRFPTLVVDLEGSLDEIRGRMSKTVHQELNRAERDPFEVRIDEDHEAFLALDARFREEGGRPAPVWTAAALRSHGTLLTARLDGEVIAGVYLLEGPTAMRYLFGASMRLEDRGQRALIGRANKHLLWLGIQRAKARELPFLDLGGYSVGDQLSDAQKGINRYKERFGGQRVDHWICEKTYSPLYRALSGAVSLVRGLRGRGG